MWDSLLQSPDALGITQPNQQCRNMNAMHWDQKGYRSQFKVKNSYVLSKQVNKYHFLSSIEDSSYKDEKNNKSSTISNFNKKIEYKNLLTNKAW